MPTGPSWPASRGSWEAGLTDDRGAGRNVAFGLRPASSWGTGGCFFSGQPGNPNIAMAIKAVIRRFISTQEGFAPELACVQSFSLTVGSNPSATLSVAKGSRKLALPTCTAVAPANMTQLHPLPS